VKKHEILSPQARAGLFDPPTDAVVDSMWEARWQSQSAKPATSQTGRMKYIKMRAVGSENIAWPGHVLGLKG
jgi:hypothetical protein